MPAINTMLSRQVDKKDYNIIFSLKQCAGPIGMALSGLVIPLLTSHFGWRVGLAFVVCLAVIVGFWSAFIKKSQDSSYQFKDEPISLEHLADSLKLVVSSKLLTRLSVVSIFYKGIQMSVLAYLVVQSINTLSIKQMRTQCLQASISSGRSPVPHSLA